MRTQRVQRQLADIVESSQDAILSKDVNGIITSWNSGAERLYGYRADEVVGKHVSMLATADQPDEIPRIMAELVKGVRVQRYRTQRVHKDGKLLTVYLSVSPLRDDHGKVVGAFTIAQDITAQLRTEETLRKSEKLATAGRLAATIAHEINNPLEAIALVYRPLTQRPRSISVSQSLPNAPAHNGMRVHIHPASDIPKSDKLAHFGVSLPQGMWLPNGSPVRLAGSASHL